MNSFTHIDANGNAVMVDVSGKAITSRTAVASGRIQMNQACYEAVRQGTMKKGDVLGVAQIGGIMGAKRTSELIPLCHILNLTQCGVNFFFHDETQEIEAQCTVRCDGKTGVEMEALTGVSVALLTVYTCAKPWINGCVSEIFILWKKQAAKAAIFSMNRVRIRHDRYLGQRD